jgi:hypothetical protein
MNQPDPSPDEIVFRWNAPDGTVEAVSLDFAEVARSMAARLTPCLRAMPRPLGDEAPPWLRGRSADAFVRRLLLLSIADVVGGEGGTYPNNTA